MDIYSITYNNEIIEFELVRKVVKNVNLNIRPDMSIIVSASEEVPSDFILDFVKSKAPWITKNINYFKKVQSEQTSKKEYVSGETFKYLGKQYRLRVIETDEEELIKYNQGFINLYIKDKLNYQKKEKLLNEWFRKRAEIKFNQSLDKMYSLIEKYDVKKPKLNIRTMKARWGSCISDKSIILLNYELIKAPKYCIDYVVLHELIHFKYLNHDKEFYDFLTSLMPDWKQRKAILDEEVVREL